MSYLEPTQFAQSMIDTGEPKIKISILSSDFTLLDYFFWWSVGRIPVGRFTSIRQIFRC